MKQDSTAVPRSFVVFACDTATITGLYRCSTADELARVLVELQDFFDHPKNIIWGRVARRAFAGRVVSVTVHGSSLLVLPASGVSFYQLRGKRLEQLEEQWHTPADLELSRLEEQAELEMGIQTELSANDDGTITLTKIAHDGTTASRRLG